MSNKPITGIITKVIIGLLFIGLYFVITIPGGIRAEEIEIRELSRKKMSIISEAEKFFIRKTNRYTTNFDSLLLIVQTDSLLNLRIQNVEATQSLSVSTEDFTNLPGLAAILRINKGLIELSSILDEVNDAYKYDTTGTQIQILEKNQALFSKVQSFKVLDLRPNFVNIMQSLDSAQQTIVDVSDFTIQDALARVLRFSDVVTNSYAAIELEQVSSSYQEIFTGLKELKLLMEKNKKIQNFTNRFGKFSDDILADINLIKSRKIEEDNSEIKLKFEALNKLRGQFSDAKYFAITQLRGLKGLEKNEALLVDMDANTLMAPPLADQKFTIELTNKGFGYKITCPNITGTLSRGIFSQHFNNYGSIDNGEKSWDKVN